jgi:hypothetical protein
LIFFKGAATFIHRHDSSYNTNTRIEKIKTEGKSDWLTRIESNTEREVK